MLIIENTQENDISIGWKEKTITNSITAYDNMRIGDPIYYDNNEKIFTPVNNGTNQALVGYFLHYNKATHIVCVMYRDFLIDNVLNLSCTLKQNYIQSYLKKTFESYKNMIIRNMPRIKRLKRIKLQMFNRTAAILMHDNLDNIIGTYAETFGNENAQEMKARIVTTPIYILDRNIVKAYDFAMNELKIPDIETRGNFLCFFMYQDQRTL